MLYMIDVSGEDKETKKRFRAFSRKERISMGKVVRLMEKDGYEVTLVRLMDFYEAIR